MTASAVNLSRVSQRILSNDDRQPDRRTTADSARQACQTLVARGQRLVSYPAQSLSLAARSRSSRARATRERMVPMGHPQILAASA